jgi:uncharacterized glyoxalase superfamily protein PhnB
MELGPMLTGSATVFTVTDVPASVAHYRDVFGFTVTFEYGTPLSYACLCRDEVDLHLRSADIGKSIPGNGCIAIFVRDVDAVHAELAARGANIAKPPQDYDYGMRDFDVLDLDGNQLVFGMASNRQT